MGHDPAPNKCLACGSEGMAKEWDQLITTIKVVEPYVEPPAT